MCLSCSLFVVECSSCRSSSNNHVSCGYFSIIVIIIHEFHGDTSLKQNFGAAVNVTYEASVNAAVAASVRRRTICDTACVCKSCCVYVRQHTDVAGAFGDFSDRRRCISKPVYKVRFSIVDFALFNL